MSFYKNVNDNQVYEVVKANYRTSNREVIIKGYFFIMPCIILNYNERTFLYFEKGRNGKLRVIIRKLTIHESFESVEEFFKTDFYTIGNQICKIERVKICENLYCVEVFFMSGRGGRPERIDKIFENFVLCQHEVKIGPDNYQSVVELFNIPSRKWILSCFLYLSIDTVSYYLVRINTDGYDYWFSKFSKKRNLTYIFLDLKGIEVFRVNFSKYFLYFEELNSSDLLLEDSCSVSILFKINPNVIVDKCIDSEVLYWLATDTTLLRITSSNKIFFDGEVFYFGCNCQYSFNNILDCLNSKVVSVDEYGFTSERNLPTLRDYQIGGNYSDYEIGEKKASILSYKYFERINNTYKFDDNELEF